MQANKSELLVSGLEPASDYKFEVSASNVAGRSRVVTCRARTKNPGLWIDLARIGIYDNCEGGLRDFIDPAGEIYLYVVATDGNTTVEKRFPDTEGSYYKLDSGATVAINDRFFEVPEVGDYLKVCVIAYEMDGSDSERAIAAALEPVLTSAITGGADLSMLGMFDLGLSGIIADLAGFEDDLVGQLEFTWTDLRDWGAGYHTEENKDLRLWLEIGIDGGELPVEGEPLPPPGFKDGPEPMMPPL
jgi:hypothetical protein